ncbi:MAG: hypothetical protein LWW86_14240 [Micrococcales bacterium]|nr:hypothetical protein [Micrococcales bacterium]
MTRRPTAPLAALLGLLVALGVTLGVLAPAERAGAERLPGPVVFIGTGGLTWTDVSQEATPSIWRFLKEGSAASMSVRSVNTNTCPIDGWLALSAGGRASAVAELKGDSGMHDNKPACQAIPSVTGPSVPGWQGYLDTATKTKFDSELGLLARQLAAIPAGAGATADPCVNAIGDGAAVAAALPDGTVPRHAAYAPSTLRSELAACPTTLVDAGSLRDPADVDRRESPQPTASREEQIRAIDARIGEVLAAAPADADILLASLSDAGESERLRLAAAMGPDFEPGRLDSPSTRQPGLVQAADLTSTLLSLTGAEVPTSLGGAVLRSGDTDAAATDDAAADRLVGLIDYDQASHKVHSLVPPFFTGFAWAQVVIYGLVALLWKTQMGSLDARLRGLSLVRSIAVIAASVPASTFLANLLPWWRSTTPMVAVVGSVGIWVALISGVALLGPWRRRLLGPLAVVATATMLTLAGDILTGARLQISSLMGLQPVVGGRYYGMGNVTFALFGTATVLLAMALADRFLRRRRRAAAALAVVAVGLVGLVIDGAPWWGADGGGPPALLPALVVLTLAVLGIRLDWKRALLLLLVTVAMFLGVAFLDSLRPAESQSHLGRFFETLMSGGAMDIIVRKAKQNLAILTGNMPLTMLVPISLAFVIYVLARPTAWGTRGLQRAYDRAPALRPGLIALLVMLTIGFAINDSGTAIPAVGATLAVPLIISISVRALEDDARLSAAARDGAYAAELAPSDTPAPG